MSVARRGEETRRLLTAQAQVGPCNAQWFMLTGKIFLFYSSEVRMWCLSTGECISYNLLWLV